MPSPEDDQVSELMLRPVPSTQSLGGTSIYSGPQDHYRPHSPDPNLRPLKPALKHAGSNDSSSIRNILSPTAVYAGAAGRRHPASPAQSRPSSPGIPSGNISTTSTIDPPPSATPLSASAMRSAFESSQTFAAPTFVSDVIPPTPLGETSPSSLRGRRDLTTVSGPSSSGPSGTATPLESDVALNSGSSRTSFDLTSTKTGGSSSSSDKKTHKHHFWHFGSHHHSHPTSQPESSGDRRPRSPIRSSMDPGSQAGFADELSSTLVSSSAGSGARSVSGASTPHGAGWDRRVGFDTMPDAMETESQSFSFTLQVKSKGYLRTKNTRTFMCAVDSNTYSERALEWLMESLVEDGDEVVALRVLEGEADTIDQGEAREDARELMTQIVELNEEDPDRKISIVIEFVAGRPTSTILRLIHMYRPDSLTVGTRGKSANVVQKMLGAGMTMGHVSRDILSRSPVPVVVVRPEAKVQKHLKKRLNDPTRRHYHDLITKSGFEALPMSVSKSKRESLNLSSLLNPGRRKSAASPMQSPRVAAADSTRRMEDVEDHGSLARIAEGPSASKHVRSGSDIKKTEVKDRHGRLVEVNHHKHPDAGQSAASGTANEDDADSILNEAIPPPNHGNPEEMIESINQKRKAEGNIHNKIRVDDDGRVYGRDGKLLNEEDLSKLAGEKLRLGD